MPYGKDGVLTLLVFESDYDPGCSNPSMNSSFKSSSDLTMSKIVQLEEYPADLQILWMCTMILEMGKELCPLGHRSL